MRIKQSLNGVGKESLIRKPSYPSGAIPPKVCPDCEKAWDYTTYADTDREGDAWNYLEDFPTRGCDKLQCPRCKQAGDSPLA
tara:strand:+ start:875 stop:1120 length:246 start_codon:yes stop_codon:yes gene_type:complete